MTYFKIKKCIIQRMYFLLTKSRKGKKNKTQIMKKVHLLETIAENRRIIEDRLKMMRSFLRKNQK